MKISFLFTIAQLRLLLLVSCLYISLPNVLAQPAKSRRAAVKKAFTTTITNFDQQGEQVARFSTLGAAVDAHDGEIAFFDGVYYLYGTSYACGFEWQNKQAPFCGFKTYSSTDMVNWTDRGFLFDPNTAVWQSRCNGGTYGCFRPHVVYNKRTGLYVLWINVYDNRVGFRVFTSKSPVNDFVEVAEPRLAVNSDSAMGGLNNGDHDTFVDDDGTAYLAYTDWRKKGQIVVDKLSPDYLTGTGEHIAAVTPGKTEAPSLFKRNGLYYLTYSDPNCGYCSGTGTSYRTAKSPLGPWSEGKLISNKSCGGQPSFVSPIQLASGTIYLYGSDLWNNAAKNEALANYYWAPLSFSDDGSINPMECQNTVTLTLASGSAQQATARKNLDNSPGNEGFKKSCEINKDTQRSQAFKPKHSGKLEKITVTSFKTGYPDAALQVALYATDAALLPTGDALFSSTILADSISWAGNNITVRPEINVTVGKSYAIVLKTLSTKGCYGVYYKNAGLYPAPAAAISKSGGNFTGEKEKVIKFETFVRL